MANKAASKKDARQSAARAQRNRSGRSAVKTAVAKVRRATVHADTGSLPEGFAETVKAAIAKLDRAAVKGLLHGRAVARRKSRLMKLAAKAITVAAEAARSQSEDTTPRRTRAGRARQAAGEAGPTPRTTSKTPRAKAPAAAVTAAETEAKPKVTRSRKQVEAPTGKAGDTVEPAAEQPKPVRSRKKAEPPAAE